MNRPPAMPRSTRAGIALWPWALALLLSLCLAGCSGDGNGAPDSPNSATIGAAGGSLSGPDGTGITLPAGALAADTLFSIRRDATGAPALPTLPRALSAVYTITPHIAALGQLATVTLPVDASKIDPNAAPPTVLIAQPGGEWEALATSPVQNGSVSAQTVHFSYVTVVQYPVRYVGAELVLPDSVKPAHPGNPWSRDYLVDTAATVSVNLRLDRSAFEVLPGGVMCGTPMTLVMGLSVYDGNVWRPLQSTSLGPYTAAATASYSVAFDYTFDLPVFMPGFYSIDLVEACDLVYNLPGLPSAGSGFTKRGAVGRFYINIQTPVDVPLIGHQPQPMQVGVGDSAFFDAAAHLPVDAAISWFRSNDGGATWTDTAITGTRITLTNVALTDDGALFRARVCGYGQCIDSWPARLSVMGTPRPPVVVVSPLLQTVVAGQSASLTATSSSAPTPMMSIYRWTGGASQLVLDCGVVSRCTYTSPALTVADDGANYFAQVVAPGHQASEADFASSSALARVIVLPPPQAPVVTTPPTAASTLVGGGVSFSVQATGTAPLAYQWLFNGNAIADRSAAGATSGVTGAGTATLTLSNAQLADAGNYSVVVSNGIAPAANSAAALLSVALPAQAPVIVTPPTAVSTQPGGTARFSVVATGSAPLSYQWLFNGAPLNDGVAGSGRATVSGSHSAELVLSNVQLADAGNYRVVVSNGTAPAATSVDVPLAVQAPPMESVPMAAGYGHTCALRRDASVACWGQNTWGELGDGTLINRPSPTTIAGLGNVVALAPGVRHSCALRSDGTVVCWGDNSSGQLGDGTQTARLAPVTVPGLNDATALVVGLKHSCVLRADTSVSCWGGNAEGELGDGSTVARPRPGAVPGLTGVTALAAGGGRTCAIKADQTLVCWGWNGAGELGDGTTVQRTSPTPVPGLTGVVGVATGQQVSCAWRADGSAACWGLNGNGQLGDGTLVGRPSPVAVAGLTGALALAVGDYHVCALMPGGAVSCWGWNFAGQLGNGNADQAHPTAIPSLTGVSLLRSGSAHTCALKPDVSLLCWGWNANGQLGDGSTVDRHAPTAVPL